MDRFIELLGFLGLLCGVFRVLPQTYKTIKCRDIAHLSFQFFLLQMLAALCGLAYECLIPNSSIPQLLFFVMIIITNSIQIIYMLLIKYSH
jgi:uncharacterized protein with PQ loop repeat